MWLLAGARDSPLSKEQVKEIARDSGLKFDCLYVKTQGDLDKKTSLRTLDSTDFFTKELDEMVLRNKIRFAIHSAKDLPNPLREGLKIVALTKGIDSRDALILKGAKKSPLIATSSLRREEAVKEILKDCRFCDIRGTIGERLQLLDEGVIDGVVIAEAALIRLGLESRERIYLPLATAPLQGRLAIVARSEDREIEDLFSSLNWTER